MTTPMLIYGQPGIYEIRSTIDNKFYIGSAINLATRRNRHFSELRKGGHYNTHLQRAFSKYGQDNFIFKALLFCEEFELARYEQALIEMLKPDYNVRIDCTTNRGIKWTSRNINSLKALTGCRTPEQMKRRSFTMIMNRLKKNPDAGINKLPGGTFRAMSGLGGNHIGCFETIEEARTAYLNYVMEKYS